MLDKASMNNARAIYYGLLGKFFIFKEDKSQFDDICDMLAIIRTNPISDTVFKAVCELLETMDKEGHGGLVEEYNMLFHSLGRGAIPKSASFYEEGIEFGKKCIQTRALIAKTSLRRDEKNYKDPEDSVGFLSIFMQELIKSVSNGNMENEKIEYSLFKDILNPFIDEFTYALYEHPKAQYYKNVAIILSSFMEFERLYFEVPKANQQSKKRKTEGGISDAEAKRRALNKAKKQMDKEMANSCEM